MNGRWCRRVLSLALPAACAASVVHAQDIEPRSYWNAPVGLNFIVGGFSHSTGGLSTDPSVPLDDAKLRINAGTVAYARSFDWWGDSGKIDVVLPYATLSGTASLLGQPVSRDVSGLLDPRVRASINFFGAPALTAQEFAAYRQDLVIGASLQLTLPWGQYDPERAINLGTHRWIVKPELGMTKAWGAWTVEAATAVSVFQRNDDYFGGHTQDRAPIYSLQTSVTRSFSGGAWAALGATYYRGGRTTIDGVERDDALGSSRIAATLSLPVDRANSIRINASSGVHVRTGTDFDTVSVYWQYRWLSP